MGFWGDAIHTALALHGWPTFFDRLKIPWSSKLFDNIRLLRQHLPLRLSPNLSQSTPPFQIFRVALITMRCLCFSPMSFGKTQHGSDFPSGNVIDETAHGSGFFKPVALPEFTWSNALEGAFLVVVAAGHRATVDGVDYAILTGCQCDGLVVWQVI